jgi:chromosome segregation ATPase
MNPLEKNLKALTESVESYERRSRKRAIIYSLLIPALLLTFYLGFIIWQINQLDSKKQRLETRNNELEVQVGKAKASIEEASRELTAINQQIAKARASFGNAAFQASLSDIETRTSNVNSKITDASKELTSQSKKGVAIVFDPPSNVRATPDGDILCSVSTKATINIYDSVGDWYYTDVCGGQGVIHKSQVEFEKY